MVDCEALGNEIAEISARINVANQRLLTCIRTFDESEGWHQQGAQSCAHWLVWRIGIDPGAAREKVRTARALGGLPKIDAAFAAGRLSYSKVRAITRIASLANEEQVLDIALAATGAQLERICSGFRTATEGDIVAAGERRVRARVLGNGLVKLEVVVSADEADLLMKALEHAREQLSPNAPDGEPVSLNDAAAAVAPRPSGADAIVHLATTYLAGGGTESRTAAPDRCQVVVHVDRDLASAKPVLAATLEDGTHVSAETLRRVTCDSGLVGVTVDEQGAVLDVGRRTRAIPTAIRLALWVRDKGCRFPGCSNDRFLHGHHVEHWFQGGRTSLSNLVLLCPFHHRQVHEGGFSLRLSETAEVEVRTAKGACLPSHPKLAADEGTVEWNGDWWTNDVGVDAWTTLPAWDGDPVDYDAAVGVLVPST